MADHYAYDVAIPVGHEALKKTLDRYAAAGWHLVSMLMTGTGDYGWPVFTLVFETHTAFKPKPSTQHEQ